MSRFDRVSESRIALEEKLSKRRIGASEGIRTLDNHLGKVELYH